MVFYIVIMRNIVSKRNISPGPSSSKLAGSKAASEDIYAWKGVKGREYADLDNKAQYINKTSKSICSS